MTKRSKVIVGMSGGVDSSVTALHLLEEGYYVEGLFMKNWEEDDDAEYCAAAEDLKDAQAVADQLGIRLHTVNFSAEYWDRVFEYFLTEYRAGRTPNPDIVCNREIKFRAFLDHALTLGAQWIATGHYARITRSAHEIQLRKGKDPQKDQSYFLCALNEQQLERAMFPLGGLEKTEVRARAARAGLATYAKKDSTGICFIGERKFKDFLQRFLPAQPGEIIDEHGKIIGEHQGLMFYTLGQRHGLGIGGLTTASEEPWYVAVKDLQSNRLTAVQGHDHPLLLSQQLTASQVNWINGPPDIPCACTAKVRYRQSPQDCVIEQLDTETVTVRFTTPQRAVTPGQAVVFYQDDRCLGGAIIDKMASLP
ncbi:MAG: tRNA 2-thiouridine(34) synthase MnmA [Thiotrichales bacterium]